MSDKKESDSGDFDELLGIFQSIFKQVEGVIDAGLHEAKLGGIEGARQRLAEMDIEDAIEKAKELVNMAIYETNAEPIIEDAKNMMASLWARVESGEVEEEVRTEIVNVLRTLQQELDKHFPQEDGENSP